MSLRAYQQVAAKTESPRGAEYRLFGQVTRALMEAAASDRSDLQVRINALDWNRRVWRVMADDCMKDSNPLSESLRAQIISLALWVGRHSSAVMRGKAAFEDLIEVNRAIMQGLSDGGQGGG